MSNTKWGMSLNFHYKTLQNLVRTSSGNKRANADVTRGLIHYVVYRYTQ